MSESVQISFHENSTGREPQGGAGTVEDLQRESRPKAPRRFTVWPKSLISSSKDLDVQTHAFGRFPRTE